MSISESSINVLVIWYKDRLKTGGRDLAVIWSTIKLTHVLASHVASPANFKMQIHWFSL